MAPPPTLRLDVRRPTPWRKAPTLLFGDRRRRLREWALAGGAGTLGIAATLCLIVGLIHDGHLTGNPTVVAAAGPPPRASDFPLIEERPAPGPPPPGPAPTLLPPTPPATTPPPPQSPAPGPETAPPIAAAPDIPPQSLTTPITAPSFSSPPEDAPPAPPSPAPAPSPAVVSPPVEAGPTPVAPPTAETPPSTPPAIDSPATPPHYLQLGTYRQRPNAVADQAHFAAQGIETVILRRGDYYVLRLPPFASRQAAEAEETRLRGLGIDCLYIGPPQ